MPARTTARDKRWAAAGSGSSTGSTTATTPDLTTTSKPAAARPARSSRAGARSSWPGRWNGDHHDGVPILVLTHDVDEGDVPPGNARLYTDVAECAAAARAGAGDKDVMVHGAGAGQALIRAGELDEIEVHLVSVLLGSGRRLFDMLEDLPGPVELHLVRLVEGRDATHLRYRVRDPHDRRVELEE